jgi:predicted NodU family carbamoyl transferase
MLLQWLPCSLLLLSAVANALRMLHQPQLQLQATSGGLILGLNKYSHDVSVCVLSVEGEYLFAAEKERLTRRKHDSGDACEVIEHALECIGARPEDVKLVVSNNHHCRVQPFEKRLPWAVATGQYPASYTSEMNLLPGAKHIELSHHLAHVYGKSSTIAMQLTQLSTV